MREYFGGRKTDIVVAHLGAPHDLRNKSCHHSWIHREIWMPALDSTSRSSVNMSPFLKYQKSAMKLKTGVCPNVTLTSKAHAT
jgi:hypothetical protein